MKQQSPAAAEPRDPREPEYEALDHLFDTARSLGSGNARHGDVRAAALRYAAEVVKSYPSRDLIPEFIGAIVADLEAKAKSAEEAQ